MTSVLDISSISMRNLCLYKIVSLFNYYTRNNSRILAACQRPYLITNSIPSLNLSMPSHSWKIEGGEKKDLRSVPLLVFKYRKCHLTTSSGRDAKWADSHQSAHTTTLSGL